MHVQQQVSIRARHQCFLERLKKLPIVGVDTLIGHNFVLFLSV